VLRADAIGIDVKRMQWVAFVIAGLWPAWRARCTRFPRAASRPTPWRGPLGRRPGDGAARRRADLSGPVVGAVTFTWLHDTVARNTDYWRAMLGGIILLLVLLFPQGIAGFARSWRTGSNAQPLRCRSRSRRRMSLLQVRGLGKSFGGVKAVDGIAST
jgi:branched-chain amino acid transport system permease protein